MMTGLYASSVQLLLPLLLSPPRLLLLPLLLLSPRLLLPPLLLLPLRELSRECPPLLLLLPPPRELSRECLVPPECLLSPLFLE